MSESRATKKQQVLFQYIRDFIKEHDYGPSYREVMSALGYKSVSTVAFHVNELIARGYLEKRDKSARSLAVVGGSVSQQKASKQLAKGTLALNLCEELARKIEYFEIRGNTNAVDALTNALEYLEADSKA